MRQPNPSHRRKPADEGCSGRPTGDAQARFGRGEDPDRARRSPWRGQHCRAVSPRGDRAEPVLSLVEDFLEAGKKRLAGDAARAATSDEVNDLRREAMALKEVVADLTLENRVAQKKRDGGWGGRRMRYPAAEKLEIIQLVEQSHLPVSAVVGADRNPKIHVLSMVRSLSDWRARGAGRLQPSA